MAEVILTSGYGTGLTEKQKQTKAFVQHPKVISVENVAAGNGSGNAAVLSLKKTVSFVTTATNSSHVKLENGIHGQVKIIVHKTRSNTTDLVILPSKIFGASGFTITSNDAPRSIKFCWHDWLGWMIIAGEISGTAEMVIA
jgi:hypothetical protein